jgi:hypothetical protein
MAEEDFDFESILPTLNFLKSILGDEYVQVTTLHCCRSA